MYFLKTKFTMQYAMITTPTTPQKRQESSYLPGRDGNWSIMMVESALLNLQSVLHSGIAVQDPNIVASWFVPFVLTFGGGLCLLFLRQEN